MSFSTTQPVAERRTQTERRWAYLIFRAGISLALLYSIYLVTVQAIAGWHLNRGSPEEIRKATEWDPDNAELYAARARSLQLSFDGTDVNQVLGLYETATRLSPNRAQYWAEFGGSYELAGRAEEARRAYARAQDLFPNSPQINWKLGNFYIRAGKTHEALSAFHKTLLGDPQMRAPVFDLAQRAGIDQLDILREMIPADTASLLAYLDFLVARERLDEASQTWARLLRSGARIGPQAVFPYLDALIRHDRVEELEAAWAAVLERSHSGLRHRSFDPNRITNGSFEDDILAGGLDWRVLPTEGVIVDVDSRAFFDGVRSLRIRFDGKHNVSYSHVLQYVPVKPNSVYRFIGYVRAQGLTTDSGPRFQICDAKDASRLSVESEPVTGTRNWSPRQLEFRTGPKTRLAVVRVARPPSRMFDNRISGTLWIDRVSLIAVEGQAWKASAAMPR